MKMIDEAKHQNRTRWEWSIFI